MTPWKPPPPVPRNLLFHVVLGSQTSILIAESLIGVSVAVTRQKAGRPVSVVDGVVGVTKTPVSLSVADVMVVCCSCRLLRFVQGVAAAGAEPNAFKITRAAVTRRYRRRMLTPPFLNPPAAISCRIVLRLSLAIVSDGAPYPPLQPLVAAHVLPKALGNDTPVLHCFWKRPF